MAPPRKVSRRSQAKSGSVSQVLLSSAISRAIEALQDPKVRALLIEHGRSAAGAAQQWRRERRPQVGAKADGDGRSLLSRTVGDRFGQRRLERRVENLRKVVAELGSGRPKLAASLAPVARAVEDVSTSLSVARAIPLAKRLRAHLKIDDVLDRLEKGLFEATLSDDPTGPGSTD